jgi:hypothetical protein
MRRNTKKKQNSYDGQIVKQSDGVYDVVIPKIISPPRRFNPLIIENIRNVGTILEESPQSNKIVKPNTTTTPPNRTNFLSLSEFTMTFSENDSNVERTLKNIELTSEEFYALKTIPGLEFRGIPLDEGSRRYCQRNEIQFDVLVSGKILNRYQCIKSQDVVKTLLHLFQLQPASNLVPSVPTGFNNTNASLTGYMAIMTQNPQSVGSSQNPVTSLQNSQNPQSVGSSQNPVTSLQNPQNPQISQRNSQPIDIDDFSKLLASKETKVTQAVQNKQPVPIGTKLSPDPTLVRSRTADSKINGLQLEFDKWRSAVHKLYKHVNFVNKSSFQEFKNKPLAISGFVEKASFITQALSETKKFHNIVQKLFNPNTETTPNPNINFTNQNWFDEINLDEPKDVLYTKTSLFEKFLTNFLELINPVFEDIRNATFESLTRVLDIDCKESYACFEYFRSGGPSIKTISLLDLLVTLRSYTCNVMNAIGTTDIEIDAITICTLENRFRFIRDLFHFLAGYEGEIPINGSQFCSMLFGFLKDITSEQEPESWLLYSFEEVKNLTKKHPKAFNTMTKLITTTNYTMSDFEVIRSEISSHTMLLNYTHFILVCILLQVCGIVKAEQLLKWLNEPSNHNYGIMQRKTDKISQPGMVSRVFTALTSIDYDKLPKI